MSKTKRGWLVAAAVLAIGASGMARAEDSGGGDAGDNGMNPLYGDSYATLQGQGHNAGAPRMQPEGAFASHEMDNQQGTPLIERMKQAQQRMAEQTRHNWDTMVQKTHAMTEKLKVSMNTQGTAAAETAGPSATPSTGAPAAKASTTTTRAPAASNTPKGMTGSTSAPSAAGAVVSSPALDMGEPMVMKPAQPTTDSGLRIAPVNPRGQAPTIVGPNGG